MNMIDMYLSMQSCTRDKDNCIYYNETDGKKTLVGKIKKYEIVDGTLEVTITPKASVQFINIKVVIPE